MSVISLPYYSHVLGLYLTPTCGLSTALPKEPETGREAYGDAQALYITADGGGSHGSRVRLWKAELQRFANDTGLTIHVSHFPPGMPLNYSAILFSLAGL
jgi:hypothetical protein